MDGGVRVCQTEGRVIDLCLRTKQTVCRAPTQIAAAEISQSIVEELPGSNA